MAQVNIWLKHTFSIFNIFLAIIGGAILGLTLLAQVLTNVNGGNNLEGLVALYVVGSVTMLIAILGVSGAAEERKECLLAFLVCMTIGSLLMLRAGIDFARARTKLEGLAEAMFREFLPLDKASDDVRTMFDDMQRQLHCCGAFSYDDWEGNIPDSCVCDQMEGKCQMVDYRMNTIPLSQSKSIYTESCFSVVLYYAMFTADIMIGFFFTLAILALLGMVLSTVIIHQIRYPDSPIVLRLVPAILPTQPPKYQGPHAQRIAWISY